MRSDHSFAITFVALTALTVPQVVPAQRGRGGGPAAGGVGRVNSTRTPNVQRDSRGTAGGEAGIGRGSGGSNMKRLADDTALARRIQPMLPPGSTLASASAGFRNEREFIAALQASRDLGVPFDEIKNQMTEGRGKSLGSAIRTLRPDLDKRRVSESVKSAERTASEEMRAARTGRTDDAVRAELRSNPRLSARLTPLLPAGMSFEQASAGFRNSGQFVAALHVAKNLNIPFSDLRARMIAGGESLGEAIHGLRPGMPAAEIDASVSAANRAAEGDLRIGEVAGAARPVRE